MFKNCVEISRMFKPKGGKLETTHHWVLGKMCSLDFFGQNELNIIEH